MLGLHRLRRALRVGRLADLVVEDVAPLGHRAVDPGRAHDDDRLQRPQLAHLLVDLLLDRRRLALAPRPVDGDQRLRLGELHPLAHRLGAEAAEDDVVDRPDPRAGQHRHRDLGDHRQVDPDHVALLHAEVLQRVGEALRVGEQFGVGDVAPLTLLAAPVVGDPLAVAGGDVAVEALGRRVEPPVLEPLVEGRVRVVEPGGRLDVPVEQLLRARRPPGDRVGGRLLVDLRVAPERPLAELRRRLEGLDLQHALELLLEARVRCRILASVAIADSPFLVPRHQPPKGTVGTTTLLEGRIRPRRRSTRTRRRAAVSRPSPSADVNPGAAVLREAAPSCSRASRWRAR